MSDPNPPPPPPVPGASEEILDAIPLDYVAPIPPALPYATPFAASPVITRVNNLLIVPREVTLPPRCVFCNEPAEQPMKKFSYNWHPQLLYFLILFPGLLIYAIVALIVRKTGKAYVGLCPKHASSRRKKIAISTITVIGSVVLLIFGISFAASNRSSDATTGMIIVLFGVIGIIVGAVIGTQSRVLSPTLIDKQYMHLKGAREPFLASLDQGY
jgi:hypothetical protein